MVSIERTVHYREKAAGMYASIPYALAQASECFILPFGINYQKFIART
jgi:hypothetical protein